MNKLNVILLIIVIVVFIAVLLFILFKYFNDRIKDLIKKIDNSEEACHEKLLEKQDIILKAIEIVETKLKIESKTFNEVKKCNITSISNFKNEKEFNKCYKELLDIKSDNPKTKTLKSFKDTLNKYDENELYIVSLRTYYNKYTMKYNNIIKKFPYNIVSFIKKYKLKLLFEGKEIGEDD